MEMFNVSRNNYFENPKENRVFTPDNLSSAIISTLHLVFGDTFNPKYCLEPSFGGGSILLKMIDKFPNATHYGNEINGNDYKTMIDLIKDIPVNIKLSNKDFYQYINPCKFDLIVANPPFSITDSGGKLKKGTWIYFMNKCFDMLTEKGKMVFILPVHWSSNTPKYLLKYKKYLPDINFIPISKSYFFKNSIACTVVYFDKSINRSFYDEFYTRAYLKPD